VTGVTRLPFILVISGPSGVGKSTVAQRVLEVAPDLRRSVSMTTRAPRKGEKDGRNYHFVSLEEFINRRDGGELLEWADVHGNLYGTPAAFVEERLERGERILLEIDVQGGKKVKEQRPDAVLVFLIPPSFEELERRLTGRKTDEEGAIRKRLHNAREEMKWYQRYDYIVVNDELDRCVADVLGVLRAESLRRERSVLVKET
jgi:guanylate kinase